LCATGALVADVRSDFVRTIHRTFSSVASGDLVDELRNAFEDLEAQGSRWLDAQNLEYVTRRFRRVADMRYHGQSFEIAVPLDGIGETPKPKLELLAVQSSDTPLASALSMREIWHDGRMQPASFVDRAHIL